MDGPASAIRVLLVDDESVLADIWKRLLSLAGMRVCSYVTGEAALAAFASHPHDIDVAVIDGQMPTMSGSRLAHRLWEMRPALPIILVTGDTGSLRLPPALGPHRILEKPLSSADLAAAIRELVAESE